jgi:hypothetical protein
MRFRDSVQDEGPGEPAPAEFLERDDVLDLPGAVVGIELGVGDEAVADGDGEEARRDGIGDQAAMLEDLLDHALVLPVRLAPDRLCPERP